MVCVRGGARAWARRPQAQSSLSSYEYCRCAVLCDAALDVPLASLAASGRAPVRSLLGACAQPSRLLLLLLRALVHANVLYVEEEEEEEHEGDAAYASSKSPAKKRARRAR